MFDYSSTSYHRSESSLAMATPRTIKKRHENYEEKLNASLPPDFHRGDIHSTARLQGYCDAMYATCATFLVLPLRNLHEMGQDESLSHFLNERYGEYIIFFIGFFVICTLWESQVKRFTIVKRLDDCLVVLVIMSLLATTMLPFSLSLKGHYMHQQAGGIITSGLIAAVELIEALIAVYAFHSPRLLHIELHPWSNQERAYLRNISLFGNLFDIILCMLAALCTQWHFSITWILISLVILLPLARKFFYYVRRHRYMRKKSCTDRCKFYWEVSKGNISKERVEAMSDAAMAIIACVLVLDITVEEFPKQDDVDHHGLDKVLHHMLREIIIFVDTYCIVSVLWYLNHTVLQMFHTIDVVLLYLQKTFLAFVSLSPFASQLLAKFGGEKTDQGSLSNLIGFLFPLCASVANMLMLCWGYYKKEKLMHQWAVHGNKDEANRRAQLYILLKTTLTPMWILVGVLGSTGPGYISYYIRIVVLSLLVLTFVVLKVVFMCHVGKKTYVPKKHTMTFSESANVLEEGTMMSETGPTQMSRAKTPVTSNVPDVVGLDNNNFQQQDEVDSDDDMNEVVVDDGNQKLSISVEIVEAGDSYVASEHPLNSYFLPDKSLDSDDD